MADPVPFQGQHLEVEGHEVAVGASHVETDRGLTEDTVEVDLSPSQQQLLERYVDAFWRKDIDSIVGLLTAEATWDMPPFKSWFKGADAIGWLIGHECPGGSSDMPMLATQANGQPAFGLYMRTKEGDFEPFHLQVLDIREGRVAHVGAFFEPSLFATFGLPARLPADFRPGDPVPSDAEVARGDHVPSGHEAFTPPPPSSSP